MLLVVASNPDEASVTIRDRLLAEGGWREAGTFDGSPAWRRDDRVLVTLREHHLYVDHVDRSAADALGIEPSAVVYVSKHRAASGRNSLTVHPIGNWHDADFGGRPGEVVPTAPGLMTDALRRVADMGSALGYEVTFEATHHGPYLERPTFFIETGSGPEAWKDERAAAVLARAVLAASDPGFPVAMGVGGGHYVPRMTDVALARKVSFGHLVPSYALDPPNWEAIEAAVARTPDVRRVYVHRKAVGKPLAREIEAFFGDRGVEPVREADFEPLGPATSESL